MKSALLSLVALSLSAGGVLGQDLVSVESAGTASQFFIQQALNDFGLTATSGIEYFRVTYTMDDLAGERDTVSGLMVVPDGVPGASAYPTLVSMHGTTQTKFDVPGAADPFAVPDLAYVYGALGYVTLAPDFLNMGAEDEEGFHPYVHARTEALAGYRMLQALGTSEAYAGRVNEQLFLTGYSQGGHASMAMHQYLIEEVPATEITAAAHMSGPYATLQVMTDSVIFGGAAYQAFGFIPYTILSYQATYPELEEALSSIFRVPYLPLVERFRDEFEAGTYELTQFSIDLLTAYATAEGNQDFLPNRMLTSDFAERLGAPNSPWRVALLENETFRFANPTPTLLPYCGADDLVPGANSVIAGAALDELGASDTEVVEVSDDPAITHGECATPAVQASLEFFARYQRIDGPLGTIEGASGWKWVSDASGLRIEIPEGGVYEVSAFDAVGRERLRQTSYRPGEVIALAAAGVRGWTAVRLTDGAGDTAVRSVFVP